MESDACAYSHSVASRDSISLSQALNLQFATKAVVGETLSDMMQDSRRIMSLPYWGKSMKKLLLFILVAVYTSMSAQAQDVISLNFVRNTGVGLMDVTDVAGVVPVDNWNSADELNADVEDIGLELFDSTGAATSAVALWQSGAASWSVGTAGSGSDGDKAMMTGYLDQSGNGLDQIHMVEVTDIPFETYDVYLYHSSSGGSNRAARYQANGTDLYTRNLAEQNVFNGFILDQHDTLEDSNASADGGNYVYWSGLSGDLLIEGQGIGVDDGAALGGNTRRAPIQGIQIVSGNFVIPPAAVGGRDEIGNQSIDGTRGNLMYGEPSGDLVAGLGQSWYADGNGGSKAGVDDIFGGDRAVPYFHGQDGTWWSGGNPTLPGIQDYPVETEGVITGNNYSVKLEGEILIEQSGTIRFLDGIDDYTYLAIDMDRSGVAGDDDAEILINDGAWTNAVSAANGGAPIVEADFQDIAPDGEWLAIEVNTSEGGGGDGGMLYWDFNDVDEIFPIEQGVGVLPDDAEFLQIPETHLRGYTVPAPLLSGEVSGSVAASQTGWEVDVDPSNGSSDAFALDNSNPDVFTSILDVEGVEIHVNPLGEVEEGDSFTIFLADSVTGTPIIGTEGWTYDPASGSIVFGNVIDGCAQGDLDGNGTVNFDDFLILSSNFGLEVGSCAEGDIDGSGTVDFNDFLTLSGNFGNAVAAASVPEPSSSLILALGAMLLGVVRRRR